MTNEQQVQNQKDKEEFFRKWGLPLIALTVGIIVLIFGLKFGFSKINEVFQQTDGKNVELVVSPDGTKPGSGSNVSFQSDLAYIEGGKIHWETSGSSSCPPLIEKALLNAETGVVRLSVKKYGNTPCTADLGTIYQTIELPEHSKTRSDLIFMVD